MIVIGIHSPTIIKSIHESLLTSLHNAAETIPKESRLTKFENNESEVVAVFLIILPDSLNGYRPGKTPPPTKRSTSPSLSKSAPVTTDEFD